MHVTGKRANLNNCLTYTKKESWRTPERYPCTWIIMVSLGWIYDLFILATQNKLEDVDGLPLNTTSTTRFPLIHVRIVGNHTTYCEDDHVNSVAPGTSSGWGQEPKRTKRNCNAIIRNSLNHHLNYWTQWKTMPCVHLDVLGRFCSRCELCSNWTLSWTCSSTPLSKLLRLMLVE